MRSSGSVRASIILSVLALTGMVAPAGSKAQAGPPTYRVILYLAEEGAPSEVQIRRLDEVWSAGDSEERLRTLLSSGSVRQLEEVAMVPGQDTPAIQFGEVRFRVESVLKEPRRDSMFLRLEVDGGREAMVKEMLARFDETIILAYPLAEGDRSVVALLIPVP